MASSKQRQTTVGFYENDYQLIAFIQEYLSCSFAEAVRVAVRAYSFHLSQVAPRKAGRPSAEDQVEREARAGLNPPRNTDN